MAYDYDSTHKRILKSAERHFLDIGFRSASIRAICKDAGVTNGAFYAHFESKEQLFAALVGPCVDSFNQAYEDCADLTVESREDFLGMFQSSYPSIETLIHYVYQHRTEFTLVLKCSGGSTYEGFVDRMVESETRNTMAFLEAGKTYMAHPGNISERIAGIFSNMAIRQAFNSFLAGMSEEQNIKETRLFSDFCVAGYRETLGF